MKKKKIKLSIIYLLLLPLLMLFIRIPAGAQEINFKGGLNYSSATYKFNRESFSDEQGYKIGYQIGANAVMPISNNYLINVGALFVNRKLEYSEIQLVMMDEYIAIIEANRWYFELPVLLRRKITLGDIDLFGESGPYLGIGIGGEHDLLDVLGIIATKSTSGVAWGSKEGEIKRFDFGVTLGFGVDVNKLEIGISYKQGLINYLNLEGHESKNRAFMLNCAYQLFSFN